MKYRMSTSGTSTLTMHYDKLITVRIFSDKNDRKRGALVLNECMNNKFQL